MFDSFAFAPHVTHMGFRLVGFSLLLFAIAAATPREAKTKNHSAASENKSATKKSVDDFTLPPEPLPSPKPSASPDSSPDASASPAPNASVSPEQIVGFEKQPPKVQQLIRSALALTHDELTYTYGSADPANGGMDCSGYIYYVLKNDGLEDVPRTASEQYVWARKAGTFRAVLSRDAKTFEMDELRPGDLLFWTGTYTVDRDPPITHTMIYLGVEKGNNNRIMVGSSDGRTYNGKSRWGVSVFDFKMPPKNPDPKALRFPLFVGYARIPGLEK